MNHLVLHPIEAPAFELDLVLRVPITGLSRFGSVSIPDEFRKSCAPRSIRVQSVTPLDKPDLVSAKVRRGCVQAFGNKASAVWVHLVGTARTSPPAWERHSRQQFTRNRKTFAKTLP